MGENRLQKVSLYNMHPQGEYQVKKRKAASIEMDRREGEDDEEKTKKQN